MTSMVSGGKTKANTIVAHSRDRSRVSVRARVRTALMTITLSMRVPDGAGTGRNGVVGFVSATKASSRVGRWTTRSSGVRPRAEQLGDHRDARRGVAAHLGLAVQHVGTDDARHSLDAVEAKRLVEPEPDVGRTADCGHQVGGPSLVGEAAVVEDADAVTQPFGFVHEVGDEDHRRSRVADLLDEVPRLATSCGVEALGELVEEHESRLVDECEGEEQPLTLAAGQGAERAALERTELPTVAQLAPVDEVARKGGEQAECLADLDAVGERRRLELSADQVAVTDLVGVGDRVEAEQRDRPGVAAAQALDRLDGGGLAGAVRSEQSEDLAVPDVEADVVQDVDVPVGLAQSRDGEGRW